VTDPQAHAPRQRPWVALGALALLLYVIVAAAAALTPSHYAQGARLLGLHEVEPLAGDARPVRSDDWGVTTPYFQIAVRSGLGARDAISPYGEPLKAFFALPSRDWSMAFKPDLWGFLVLDPARAYALHYALLAVSALVGAYLVLRQLGCRGETAAAVSAMLFFSQFLQVWWSSNAPGLGLAFWPAAAFLWRGPWHVRLPAIAYASAIWLIGQLYPPFIVATVVALAVAVAAFRPEALRPGRLLPALAAAGLGIGLAWLHYGDLIPLMADTVYPGQRISDGGQVHLLQVLAHLFPHLVTQRFEPIPLWLSNACEIAVAGSFLPLAMACFCDGRAFREWAARNLRAVAIWGAGLALMLVWILAPIPGQAAPFLNHIPPLRLLWGFGLLLMIGLAVAAEAQTWRISRRRLAAFIAAALAAWAVSKLALAKTSLELDRFDPVIVVILGLLLAARRLAPADFTPRRTVLATVALSSAVTFGTFNPIQPAGPIFSPAATPALDALRAYASANPRGVVVAPGLYAATLNGVGVPAVNHTLLQPQIAYFAKAFPALGAQESAKTFNRYAHVMPALVWAPTLAQEDVIAVPPDPFAIPLPVAIGPDGRPPDRVAGAVEKAVVRPLGPGRWGLLMSGWTDWRGVSADQTLRLSLAPGAGRVVYASAYRLPRIDQVEAKRDPALFAAGFGLRAVIETGGAPPTAEQLSLVASDRSGARRVSPPPAIAPEPPAQVVWPTAPGSGS
jgi:hypothetical protein